MAQQIEDTRYIVIEYDRISKEPKPAKLVSSLKPYHKRYAPFASDEEFAADCESGITKRFGLVVRVASEEDVEKHGGDVEIHKLADAYGTADERAKQEKLAAARKIVPHFMDKVKNETDLVNLLVTYSISTTQLMAMAKDVREEGIVPSDDFVKIYCDLVSTRTKKTAKFRPSGEVRKIWNAARKPANASSAR
ncbi:hypothetical protein [Curtobacterium sp. PhB115]|uniref:hypothetical protein n=1 Tax=Curtobacterium sp. PhB115 TaxID=2485173 RepID=UPI000F4CB855|nr:hypothetical protein [Curtobacterium sp. PhB115]ROP74421.1 hypothetical protein EDF19_0505 [Curtobacterium sp. PhB115]